MQKFQFRIYNNISKIEKYVLDYVANLYIIYINKIYYSKIFGFITMMTLFMVIIFK